MKVEKASFDDIDELSSGDLIYIYILNRSYCYKVYGRQIILPTEINSIKPESDKDILTLITCYPFGINSHRLLINAERTNVENTEDNKTNSTVEAAPLRNISDVLIICSVIASVAILTTIYIVCRKKKKRKERGI